MSKTDLVFEQREAHLGHLAAENLRDLGLNEGAPYIMRKAAVQMMLDKGYVKQAKHPGLALLLSAVQDEKTAYHEVEAVVESSIEGEIPHAGAPSASVTTQTMFQDEIVQNASALGDDALGENFEPEFTQPEPVPEKKFGKTPPKTASK